MGHDYYEYVEDESHNKKMKKICRGCFEKWYV